MLFQGREATTSMYITRNDTIGTIGTDLIQIVEIDICGKSLQICTTNAVDNITNMHSKLLDESLGTFPNFKHTITISSDTKPHVTIPRSIPFSRREAIATECQNMI